MFACEMTQSRNYFSEDKHVAKSTVRRQPIAGTLLALLAIVHGLLLPAFSRIGPDSISAPWADAASRLSPNDRRPAAMTEATGPAKEQARKALANTPVRFEANRGQADSTFDFIVHGNHYAALLNASQSLFTFR